jgi:NADPH-dependent glutamate synthase beta subunit-like oxidoreductase/ferredoxin/Pyruvate/2-oxoacid:ferredoxin oxidoreductase delta subunit
MSIQKINISINGKDIECQNDETVLDAALNAGIYIPTLCYHPDLESFGACGLCAVEIDGAKEPILACNTTVQQGMKVTTNSPNLKKIRQEKLAVILTNHPHACLVCAEREGCAREPCSLNVPMSERCCEKLGDCELERVADYIGIPENTPRYKPKNLPKFDDNPFIIRNYNLCVGCGRCIRVCSDIRGIETLGNLPDPPELIDPSIFPEKLMDSGCQFCGLCVEVCPTGALSYSFEKIKNKIPCQENCPANIDIPGFLRQIANERYSDALATIYQTVPFPGTLGYVCNYPCESKCLRADLDDAVSIRALKRFAFEQTSDIKIEKFTSNPGKNIAVIGSGPAGLSCAFFLAKWGHNVTVFEAKSKYGGMLRYGIPTFRLPRDVFEREIEVIKKIGVKIKVNTPISSVNELLSQDFDAVFVSIGAQKGLKMDINGEDDPRVLDALQFLSDIYGDVTCDNNILKKKNKIGKLVAVIGGGNTAIDAARTALRLGAKVTLFYRRSEAEMPAFVEEIKEAKKEGVEFRFLTMPIAIHPNKNKLEVEFTKMKLGSKDKSKRPRPIPVENSNFSLEFDNVIKAIGQMVIPIEGIKINTKSWTRDHNADLKVQDNIYIGGDIVGPSSVVESVAMGRRAAIQIHLYLGGLKEDTSVFMQKPLPRISSQKDFLRKRSIIPMMKVFDRLSCFSEVEFSLDKSDGIGEAIRCFQCDLCLHLSKVPRPPVDMLIFNVENIALVPESSGVFTLFDKEKKVVEIKGTVNMRRMLKEKFRSSYEIKYFKFEKDPMYSKRESELLQQYIHQHGKMPKGGDELDDLF